MVRRRALQAGESQENTSPQRGQRSETHANDPAAAQTENPRKPDEKTRKAQRAHHHREHPQAPNGAQTTAQTSGGRRPAGAPRKKLGKAKATHTPADRGHRGEAAAERGKNQEQPGASTTSRRPTGGPRNKAGVETSSKEERTGPGAGGQGGTGLERDGHKTGREGSRCVGRMLEQRVTKPITSDSWYDFHLEARLEAPFPPLRLRLHYSPPPLTPLPDCSLPSCR